MFRPVIGAMHDGQRGRISASFQILPFTLMYECSEISPTVPNSLTDRITRENFAAPHVFLASAAWAKAAVMGKPKGYVGLPIGSLTTNLTLMFTMEIRGLRSRLPRGFFDRYDGVSYTSRRFRR